MTSINIQPTEILPIINAVSLSFVVLLLIIAIFILSHRQIRRVKERNLKIPYLWSQKNTNKILIKLLNKNISSNLLDFHPTNYIYDEGEQAKKLSADLYYRYHCLECAILIEKLLYKTFFSDKNDEMESLFGGEHSNKVSNVEDVQEENRRSSEQNVQFRGIEKKKYLRSRSLFGKVLNRRKQGRRTDGRHILTDDDDDINVDNLNYVDDASMGNQLIFNRYEISEQPLLSNLISDEETDVDNSDQNIQNSNFKINYLSSLLTKEDMLKFNNYMLCKYVKWLYELFDNQLIDQYSMGRISSSSTTIGNPDDLTTTTITQDNNNNNNNNNIMNEQVNSYTNVMVNNNTDDNETTINSDDDDNEKLRDLKDKNHFNYPSSRLNSLYHQYLPDDSMHLLLKKLQMKSNHLSFGKNLEMITIEYYFRHEILFRCFTFHEIDQLYNYYSEIFLKNKSTLDQFHNISILHKSLKNDLEPNTPIMEDKTINSLLEYDADDVTDEIEVDNNFDNDDSTETQFIVFAQSYTSDDRIHLENNINVNEMKMRQNIPKDDRLIYYLVKYFIEYMELSHSINSFTSHHFQKFIEIQNEFVTEIFIKFNLPIEQLPEFLVKRETMEYWIRLKDDYDKENEPVSDTQFGCRHGFDKFPSNQEYINTFFEDTRQPLTKEEAEKCLKINKRNREGRLLSEEKDRLRTESIKSKTTYTSTHSNDVPKSNVDGNLMDRNHQMQQSSSSGIPPIFPKYERNSSSFSSSQTISKGIDSSTDPPKIPPRPLRSREGSIFQTGPKPPAIPSRSSKRLSGKLKRRLSPDRTRSPSIDEFYDCSSNLFLNKEEE
ncbi:hypothetical protein SNEBB_004818 [Seison nebaliae]|nr:hypothetical protein SNEBB_004818 [Seison nebaliae]